MMIWIIFAHYIADWALQNDFMTQNKGKYWIVMLSHCAVWAGVVCFILNWLGLFAFWKVIFLIAGHWVMDKIKCKKIKYLPALKDVDYKIINNDDDVKNLMKGVEKYNLKWLYIDQLWHLIQCWVVYQF